MLFFPFFQIILLHKHRPEKVNFLVTKNDWDAVKTIW